VIRRGVRPCPTRPPAKGAECSDGPGSGPGLLKRDPLPDDHAVHRRRSATTTPTTVGPCSHFFTKQAVEQASPDGSRTRERPR